MSEPLVLRRATAADVTFLVEAICEAEKAGTERLSYCEIFGIQEDDFRTLLASMLLEDLPGQELCTSGFLVAERASSPVGACCAWVEGAEGVSSSILKANLLMHFIDAERMRNAQHHFKRLASLTIARTEGAVQIESVYVRRDARGAGLTARLIEAHLTALAPSTVVPTAQVILTATNTAAQHAYMRAGFTVAAERWADDEVLAPLLPSLGKLLMERHL